MFSWIAKRSAKVDHPMFSLDEAKSLLAELPKDEPPKTLEEITSWLESVTATPGFPADLRIGIVKLLDETGQPTHAELLKKYLEAPHLQDFQGMRQWQGMHLYTRELARAYEECMSVCKREMKPYEQQEIMPLLCVRLLRSSAEHMKLELMRYLDVGPTTWERMYRCFSLAEEGGYTRTMLYAYPGFAIHTSAQHEMLRALVLHESSPGNLAPDQIEVAFRIAGRMVSFFDLTSKPDVSSEYCFDLAKPAPPRPMDDTIVATPTMRYFSPLRALPRISEIIRQHEHGGMGEERRFGSEFTPKGKLTVLKHLLVYWNKFHPRRALTRRGISANVEVAHGFRAVGSLVPKIDLNQAHGLTQEEAAQLTARGKFTMVADSGPAFTPETWTIVDASMNGLGAMIPRSGSAWVKVGALIAIRPQNVPAWWVSVIRRLHTDQQNVVHAGLEVLGKKSLSVWLRVLGKGAERVSNWETSSGSFKYDYFPAILLPDAQNSYAKATMLLESGSYTSGKVYEIMLGEKSRNIELTGLLAEGEDYELVTFNWLVESHTR
jgi:hypothetical protein